jgi:hypothetical protein
METSRDLAVALAQFALVGELEKKYERESEKLGDMVFALTDKDFNSYMIRTK